MLISNEGENFHPRVVADKMKDIIFDEVAIRKHMVEKMRRPIRGVEKLGEPMFMYIDFIGGDGVDGVNIYTNEVKDMRFIPSNVVWIETLSHGFEGTRSGVYIPRL